MVKYSTVKHKITKSDIYRVAKRWSHSRFFVVALAACVCGLLAYSGYQYVKSRNPLELGGHKSAVIACTFLPNRDRVATMCSQHVRICDMTGRAPILLSGHAAPMTSLVPSADGEALITASNDGVVKIWSSDTGAEIASIAASKGKPIMGLALSHEGDLLATASKGGLVKIWNTSEWKIRHEFTCICKAPNCLAFDRGANQIAVGMNDGTVELWNWKSKSEPACWRHGTQPVYCVAFSPSNRELVTGGMDRTLRLWKLDQRSLIAALTGHWGKVNAAVFSPDGKRLVSASSDFSLILWDLTSAKSVDQFRRHPSQVMCLSCDFAKNRLLSGGYGPSAKLWRDFLR